MPVAWRREDLGYAAATAAAVAFLAYLVFGNFGLVPSPLARGTADDEVLVATQVENFTQALEEDEPAPQVVVPPAPEPAPRVVPVPPPPPAAADSVDPLATITTQDETQLTLARPAAIDGRASDDDSGVASVDVTFAATSGEPRVVPATVVCDATDRRACTWSAEAPELIGSYTVTAVVTDREGNRSKSEPITITIVNAGGPVRELTDTVGDTVGGLVETVGGLLGL